MKLLSFGDDAEAEEAELEAILPKQKKLKSAHDVLDSDRLKRVGSG